MGKVLRSGIIVGLLAALLTGRGTAGGTIPAASARASGNQDSSSPSPEPWPSTFAEVQRALTKLETDERRLERAQREAADQVQALRQRRLLTGRQYARLARAGLLPLGGGMSELTRHAAKLERVRRALTRDVELEHRLTARRLELVKRLEAVRTRRLPLEAQRRTLEDVRASALAAQDRALAFQRAFIGSDEPAHTAVYSAGIGPDDDVEVSGGFAASKGRLPFPVPGRAEITRVLRTGAGGVGLEVRAAAGSAVRAIHSGRVAFAERYGDYRKTVIIDHGGGYFTVSANLGLIAVSLGDEVAIGTRLGTLEGSAGTGTLYFEVRKNGELVDPGPWFGL